ncbi:MAG: OmpA family protein [Betaproteobacteria bacterium]|nr:MAG: OmpA family protein [Betaproteobacteria bacterium]
MTNGFTCKASAAAVALTLAALSGAAGAASPGYVTNSQNQVWTTPYGLCWRTTGWSPENASAPCDARPRAEAPPPIAAAPAAPVPQPAPLAAPAPIIEKVSLGSDVLFEFDKAALRPEGRQKLDELAERIKDAQVDSILAVGHADRIGSEQYNEKLSAERAAAVREYLAQKGISEDKVRTEGRGESEPVTGDQCKGRKGAKLIACLQPDRRVDVEVRGTREVAGTGSPSAGAGSTSR